MDHQKAIEILKRNKPNSDTRECGKELCTACDVAISAMQELQEYRKIGTLKDYMEAVKRQQEFKNCGYKIHSEHISKLNSCNDCGRKGNCPIMQ